jgi:hypothetical protein
MGHGPKCENLKLYNFYKKHKTFEFRLHKYFRAFHQNYTHKEEQFNKLGFIKIELLQRVER